MQRGAESRRPARCRNFQDFSRKRCIASEDGDCASPWTGDVQGPEDSAAARLSPRIHSISARIQVTRGLETLRSLCSFPDFTQLHLRNHFCQRYCQRPVTKSVLVAPMFIPLHRLHGNRSSFLCLMSEVIYPTQPTSYWAQHTSKVM